MTSHMLLYFLSTFLLLGLKDNFQGALLPFTEEWYIKSQVCVLGVLTAAGVSTSRLSQETTLEEYTYTNPYTCTHFCVYFSIYLSVNLKKNNELYTGTSFYNFYY